MATIYIDSLFVLNLILNYLLLLLSARLTGLPFCRRRLLAGAAVGAVYAVLTVLPGMQWLSAAWVKCAVPVPMTAAAFGMGNGLSRFLRGLLLFWVSSFLLAGLVLGLGLLFGRATLTGGLPYVPVSLRTLLLTAAAAYFVLTLAFKGFARYGGRTSIVPVQVSYHGRSSRFDALVDTGHALTDPMTGQPVLVADLACVTPLLPREARALVTTEALSKPIELLEHLQLVDSGLHLRLIPYQTIGSAKSWLLAFKPDAVTIGGKERETLLIGMSPTSLSDGKPFAALVSA